MLAYREREPKEMEMFAHQYHWNEIPAEEGIILSPEFNS